MLGLWAAGWHGVHAPLPPTGPAAAQRAASTTTTVTVTATASAATAFASMPTSCASLAATSSRHAATTSFTTSVATGPAAPEPRTAAASEPTAATHGRKPGCLGFSPRWCRVCPAAVVRRGWVLLVRVATHQPRAGRVHAAPRRARKARRDASVLRDASATNAPCRIHWRVARAAGARRAVCAAARSGARGVGRAGARSAVGGGAWHCARVPRRSRGRVAKAA